MMKRLIIILFLVYTAAAAQNRCVSVDGINDYVLLPVNAFSTPDSGITIEAWIKSPPSLKTDEIIISLEGVYAFYLNRANRIGTFLPFFDGSTAGESEFFGDTLNNGQWHHLAATNDGDTTRVFIDGKYAGKKAESFWRSYTLESFDRSSTFGAQVNDLGNYFEGFIDEVRIWNRALSEDEIAAGMADTLTYSDYSDSSLLGYWRFDKAMGDTLIKDLSLYGNDAILKNGAHLTESFPYITALPKHKDDMLRSFTLYQNYPNPFNPSTTIRVFVAKPVEKASINIYDILGNKIRMLYKGPLNGGEKIFEWNGKNDMGEDVSSGVYYYEFVTLQSRAVKKMMLLR